MEVKQAQSEVNNEKSELISILFNIEPKTKKDLQLKQELEKIVIKLEVWQHK